MRQGNMLQIKQDKTSEKELNEVEISNLPKRVQNNCYKLLFSPDLREVDELSANFNKDRKYKKEIRAEEYNNGNEKYTRSNQQIRGCRRMNQ